jgi:uncharacterized protein YuzE
LASLEYDKQAKVLYVKLSDKKIRETEVLNDSTFLDIADDGSLVGIEIMLHEDLPEEKVKKMVLNTSSIS